MNGKAKKKLAINRKISSLNPVKNESYNCNHQCRTTSMKAEKSGIRKNKTKHFLTFKKRPRQCHDFKWPIQIFKSISLCVDQCINFACNP